MSINYRNDPIVLEQLRGNLVGPYVDDYVRHLEAEGTAGKTIHIALGVIRHFGRWASNVGLQVLSEFDEVGWRRLEEHAGSCRCFGRPLASPSGFLSRTRRFLEFVRAVGGVVPALPAPRESPVLLREFADWATRQRGLRSATIADYCCCLRDLIAVLGEEPQRYQVGRLRASLLDYQQRHGRSRARHAVTALRSFLRYLSATGRCCSNLADAIPSVVDWKLSSLPRYLPAEDIERIIAACDDSSPVGMRDRAILLLLARLALRASDVARLRLEDIDWESGAVRVAGKGRRETRLPLTQEVGAALAAYVERGRPKMRFGEVFLRVRAPLRPLTSQRVSGIAESAIRRAGVEAPSYGSHVLRHSAATELLRQGASLDEIGALLRHRFYDTTAIYAKVDIALLRLVAQPWPEVIPC